MIRKCKSLFKRWGPGNSAEDYDDLGKDEEVDKCCREHDHCDNIPSGEEKYGLRNNEAKSLSNVFERWILVVETTFEIFISICEIVSIKNSIQSLNVMKYTQSM